MSLTLTGRSRPAAWLFALLVVGACTAGADRLMGPSSPKSADLSSEATTLALASEPCVGVVISQVYGGGGNNGATYKNDFIELYNGSTLDVPLGQCSVQYASAAGSSWQVTPLAGTLQSGHYYLVKEAAGTGGTTDLPLPDAVGTGTGIPMSGTAGKVAFVKGTTPLAGTGCPQAAPIVDYVGYGNATGTSNVVNCFEGAGPAPVLANTTAAIRLKGGQQDTDNNGADFASGTATPRNSSSTPLPPVPTLSAAVAPLAQSISVGGTLTFTASATKAGQAVTVTSAAWTSSDPTVATIDPASGAATGVAQGSTTISVTVTTDVGTASASTPLTVTGTGAPGALVISQVYGGGGNSGATLKNDFVELYNSGTTPVNLAGWSIQYSNATAAGWLVTTKTDLSGVVPAGHYFLIQEAAGAGGTTDLAAPDFIAGTPTNTNAIAIGGTSGKIALVNSTALLTGNCPKANATVVDFVGYGLADCFKGSAAAPLLTNTTAALRKDYGRTNTNDNAADFEADDPTPHNSTQAPPTVGPATQVVISPASWSLNVGQTKAFTARALDASNFRVYGATFTWTTGDATIATVEATGVATGRKVGSTTVRAATAGVSVPGTATIDVTPVAGTIIVQARTNPLPVGFQTQLFLSSGVDANGNPVGNADVTWSSSAPGVVSVNPSTGVLTANGVGQAVLTATAKSDGISKGTTTIVTNNPPTNPNARTGHNTELGTPTDADASDDIIIARRQYTTSYNPRRGVTNWVSWNLDASHKGSVLRCNCFTADTALVRLGLPAYETSDWINNGSNGQYSRGHMSPSADWQISDGDNAPTFFLTNMLPQNQAMNGGPWGDFENYLRTRAVGSTEIYIISGGIFTKGRRGAGSEGFGTISNAGKIAIPDSIWKVAVIVPDGRAASGIVSPADVEVIAINTPNEAPAAGASYSTYFTTVDSIQKSTGYNLLSILPEAVQCRLEVRNCAPAATIAGSGVAGGSEGQTLDFAGSASTDPDGDALTYRWDVDGQAAGTQPSLSYRFGNDGTYQVRLIVTDSRGASDTAAAAVRIANVAPTVNALSGAAISEGGVYAMSGSFNDPGDDRWAATVSYGDGSGAQPLTLVGRTFSLSHTYANNGQYTVTVTVSETGAGAAGGSQSATVTVANVAPVVAAFDGATILRGERYDAAGTFADPGADQWSATVNYGDGSGSSTLALDGFGFSLQHTYTTAGVRTVTVSVADADGGAGTRTAQVTVLSTEGGVAALASTIAGLASTGAVQDADARWLANKLDVAAKELARGNSGPARNQLEQVVERIAAALSAGRLSGADAASLTAYATRLLASMS